MVEPLHYYRNLRRRMPDDLHRYPPLGLPYPHRVEEPKVPASVWADGSCVFEKSAQRGLSFTRGTGGWAAIIERGSQGYVRRGSALTTTATRMEMTAVIEALRSLPDDVPTRVTTDLTTICAIHQAWEKGDVPLNRGDSPWYRQLVEQFERIPVTLHLLAPKERDTRHQRCHLIAGAEAKAREWERGRPPMPGMRWDAVRGWTQNQELRGLSDTAYVLA